MFDERSWTIFIGAWSFYEIACDGKGEMHECH